MDVEKRLDRIEERVDRIEKKVDWLIEYMGVGHLVVIPGMGAEDTTGVVKYYKEPTTTGGGH